MPISVLRHFSKVADHPGSRIFRRVTKRLYTTYYIPLGRLEYPESNVILSIILRSEARRVMIPSLQLDLYFRVYSLPQRPSFKPTDG